MNTYRAESDEIAVITVTKDGVALTDAGDVEFCILPHTTPAGHPVTWVAAISIDSVLGVQVPQIAGTYDIFYRVDANPETPVDKVVGSIRVI